MKVTQEQLPASQVGLEIEVPGEVSKSIYESVVNKLSRNVNIPGFRRGKVPRSVMLQRLGASYVKATVLEELIEAGVKTAVQQENIKILGNLQLKSDMEALITTFEPGAPVTFRVALDVFPEAVYESDSYKTLTVKAEEIKYDPDRVEKWLKEAQEKRATLVPVEDRGAQMGDVAIANYQAFTLDEGGQKGDPIEEVKGTDFTVQLEAGRFVEGIVEGIVGMKPGETKDIPVTFPEDYPLEPVAGEKVSFEITVTELKWQELPELDDDFAEEVSEFETLAALREDLEKQFQDEAQQRTDSNIRSAIKVAVGDLFTEELPETLINEESQNMIARTLRELEEMGLNVSQLAREGGLLETIKQNARPEAIAKLKSELMIGTIAKQENLNPTPEAIEAKSQELREQFQGQKIDPDRLNDYVFSTLLEENVITWLKDVVTIELVPEGTLTPEPAIAEETEETEATETQEETP